MKKIDFTRFTTKEFIITALLYFIFFLFLIHAYRDYDWGWHYRYGEHFFKTGKILLNDPFSWTMPGYIWINHSWAFDPLLYILYSVFGFTGLTLAGAIVSFFIFLFGVIDRKLSFWKTAILMLFFANVSSGVIWQGLRSQMIGVLFLSIFLFLLRKLDTGWELQKKYIYFLLPPFFVLWVNFHGYFLIGLVCFGISIFSDFITHFKKIKNSAQGLFLPKDLIVKVLVLFLCFFATFINPFSYQVYIEAYKHSGSPLLPYILEWMPADILSLFYALFIFYAVLLFSGFIWKRNINILKWFFISVFAFILALGARRYMLVFMAASLPLASYLLASINLKLEKYRTTWAVGIVAIIISLEIAFFSRFVNFGLYSYDINTYCRLGSQCSERVTRFLIQNPPKGRGLNYYDWGGYLIGKGVPFKLFIDGRMHLWEDKNHFQPFYDYQMMYYEGDYKRFNEYNFDWLLVDRNSRVYNMINTRDDVGKWNVKYEDGIVIYLERVRE